MNYRSQQATICRSRQPTTVAEMDSQTRAPTERSAMPAKQITIDNVAFGAASNSVFLVQRTSANSPASASSSAASADGCTPAAPAQPGPRETMEREIPSSPSRPKEQILAQRRIQRLVRYQQVVIQSRSTRPLVHLL